MDERRVADYFVVAGLPENPEPLTDFSRDGTHLKSTHNQAPITDIAVFFPGLGELVPPGYKMIESTPTGYPADLNHGSLRSPEVYLCIRRGWDRMPLVDIGVMYEGKERIMADSEVVLTTPGGRYANVNNSAAKTYVTFRRAPATMPCNELVVTDVCVVLASKGEVAPHAFCMINKNLNKGIVGANVFLCYKKSMNRANLISYKPGVLARYPHADLRSFPFPSSVPMFCLPMGSSMECWPVSATQPRPVFSTFVLTVADASEKVYGSAVTFYEPVPAASLSAEQRAELKLGPGDESSVTVNVNKSVCLLSHWPFFDTFEKFLTFIYDLGCNQPPQAVPIERHISHFFSVPFPSAQRPHILVQLSGTERVVLTQPEDLPLPRSGASFRELLLNLGSENCLLVLLLALTEQKLLVHSLRPNVLTAVAEAISMVMFPLKWQCPYIPLCPLGLAEVLHAPLPFLIGVDSRFFDMYDPPPDVTCIDLDTNHITVCEEKRGLSSKLLPKRPTRMLRSALDQLFSRAGALLHHGNARRDDDNIDREFKIKRKEQALELEIQEAFLRLMASVLKGYRVYLLPITKAPTAGTTDPGSLFDLASFLRSRDKAHHKFFTMLTRTQMFIRFIEERSFVSDMDAGLAFFDECTEKVDCEDGDGRLVERDESHHSERTVFILPPEPLGAEGTTYTYHGFTLDPALFGRRGGGAGGGGAGGGGAGGGAAGAGADTRLAAGNVPGSPMARRTKHEMKSAVKLARKNAGGAESWAKCLLATCYSVWFIHLPAYAVHNGAARAPAVLRAAYHMLVRIHKLRLQPTDEVCYRVMMQLCGVYSQPVLAVKLLFHMKRANVQPNAITYGFYNRAVLDSQWPSDCTNSSQLMWNKLRNVIVGVALFRRAGSRWREEAQADATDGASRTSLDSEDSAPDSAPRPQHTGACDAPEPIDAPAAAAPPAEDPALEAAVPGPGAAAESGSDSERSEGKRIVSTAHPDFKTFDRFRSRIGSIVRPSGLPLLSPAALQQQSFESSAGLLMTGGSSLRGPSLRGPSLRGPRGSEEDDTFELSPSESPLLRRRQRYRTGSLSADCQVFPGLRHGTAKGPASPKEPPQDSTAPDLGMLIRSESFANDAQILGNLRKLRGELRINNGHVGEPRDDIKRFVKPSLSRSLFGRGGAAGLRGSANSVESSSEQLSERSSTGSADDLDCTPRHSLSAQGRGAVRAWDSGAAGSPDEASDEEPSARRAPPKSSPARMPVTENDPLGALAAEAAADATPPPTRESSAPPATTDGLQRLEGPGGPLLFAGSKGVSRSATFTHDAGATANDRMVERERSKPMHRSSTMPVDVTPPSGGGPSAIGSLGSSFKLPFSRYSPGRFSLRKEDLKIGTQYIENAISNFSPSSLTSKKSNELLLGGLNSLKSAVTSVGKKFDEIKEAMSTPVKTPRPRGSDARADGSEEDMVDSAPTSEAGGGGGGGGGGGHLMADSWPVNLWEYFNDGSRKGSATNLQPMGNTTASQIIFPENLYPRGADVAAPPPALELALTSCSKCHHCSGVLYDEEVMAGWLPEDSNLNTKCQFCGKATVPFLTVVIADFRSRPADAADGAHDKPPSESDGRLKPEEDAGPVPSLEPITVPYLNPLVLRKELENILHGEGDACLTQPKFVDEHPIIYWNMVWAFDRINVVSHLPSLSLGAATVCRGRAPPPPTSEPARVAVRCLWDNPRLHEEVGLPMYVLWQQNGKQSSLVSALVTDRTTVPRAVMQSVLQSVRCSDLLEPLKKLASERHKVATRGATRTHSLYRDILYLSMTVMGRDNIDQAAFDREYMSAFERLPERDRQLTQRCDRPLSTTALCCRHYFRPLQL